MTIEAQKETLDFQAEVRQLLNLMIHSLYSNKEIFLRELISNASDACDKLRFEALSDHALYEDATELKISISYNKDRNTITISDNGIGMNRAEVIENLGTIARSGTRQFMEALTGDQAKDAKFIGQFGVGFYSAFIVADKVTVTTRRAGLTPDHAVRWESSGEGSYSIENAGKPTRGTDIELHLREGNEEFLHDFRLENIIKKYSDHISLPIVLQKEGKEEGEIVNQASALWARPKKEISEAEYHEFYKHVAHDFENPLAHVHSRVEGKHAYTTLFYIPARAPFDLWDRDRRHGIKLYVRRVFIMDDAEQLMPVYLRFVRGIVDSDDLPLNISREILQNNRIIDTIRSASIKKVLGLLEQIAESDKDKYQGFWQAFGRVLKEGPGEDYENRERIAKLLRFASTHNSDDAQSVALADYIGRMKPEQKAIYYITAENHTAAKHSPHLEIFRKKGIEVLLLSDRVDEWLTSHLTEFEGKPLQSVAKGVLELGGLEEQAEKQELEQAADVFKPIIERMQKALDAKVKEVRLSHRLIDSPSCLVVEEQDMAVNMQKLLKAAGHHVPSAKPALEINPQHPLIERLKHETDDRRFDDWSQILFDQALLAEGGQLEDPATFVKRLNELLLVIAK